MSYKECHEDSDYGEKYKKSYETGYNFWQWSRCEKPLIERIFKKQVATGKSNYLDFACGTGRILAVGETVFENATGIDVSESMLSEAATAVSKAKLLRLDITTEPPPEQFSVISSFRFLNNAEKELSRKILLELNKALDDNGTLIVNIHRNAGGLLALSNRLRKIKVVENGPQFRSFGYTRELLREAGFEITETVWYSFLPKLSIYPEWLLKLSFGILDPALQKLPGFTKRWAQCFIVVCKKRAH